MVTPTSETTEQDLQREIVVLHDKLLALDLIYQDEITEGEDFVEAGHEARGIMSKLVKIASEHPDQASAVLQALAIDSESQKARSALQDAADNNTIGYLLALCNSPYADFWGTGAQRDAWEKQRHPKSQN